ncbi:MAG: hypothetical protein QXJ27_07510 [Thermoplasmata archaeon]
MRFRKLLKTILIVVVVVVLTFAIGLFIWYCSFLFPYTPDSYKFEINIYAEKEINYTLISPCLIDEKTGKPLRFMYSLSVKGDGIVNLINRSSEWCLFIQGKGNMKIEYASNGEIGQFSFSRLIKMEDYSEANKKYITRIDVFTKENRTIYFELVLEFWHHNQQTICESSNGTSLGKLCPYTTGESTLIISYGRVFGP